MEIAHLILEYYPAVRNHADRLCKNDDIAQDVTQETFLTALKSARTFKKGRPIWNWLYGILMHRVTDQYRRRSRIGRLEEKGELADTIHERLSNDRWYPREDYRSQLEELIEQLPSRQKLYVRLHYFKGLTSPEIADELNMTKGGVDAGLHRARNKLRELQSLAPTKEGKCS